jgi:hypothetical protein
MSCSVPLVKLLHWKSAALASKDLPVRLGHQAEMATMVHQVTMAPEDLLDPMLAQTTPSCRFHLSAHARVFLDLEDLRDQRAQMDLLEILGSQAPMADQDLLDLRDLEAHQGSLETQDQRDLLAHLET